MSWITLFKRYSYKVQTWEKKCFKGLCNHVVFEFSGDVCAPPLKGLTPLEKSYDVYERYVEESIKLKDQMLYG